MVSPLTQKHIAFYSSKPENITSAVRELRISYIACKGIFCWPYGQSYMKNAREALDVLDKYITENKTVIQGRFDEEYPGVRLGVEFTPF